MAYKIIILLLTLVALFSCTKRSDFVYTEIDNKELKDQVTQYANYIDSIDSRTEKILTAIYKKKNDSTVLFDLSYIKLFESKASMKETLSFTFICRINERDVLFFDDALESRFAFQKPYHFFKNKSEIVSDIVDGNFQNDYPDMASGQTIVVCFDPYHYHLTFVNGKLTQKTVQMGDMFMPELPDKPQKCWF